MENYVRYKFEELPDLSYLKAQGHDVVILNPFIKKEAVLDEEGNIIEPAIISDKIPVDVIYHNSEPSENLAPYKVTPQTPKHKIFGK